MSQGTEGVKTCPECGADNVPVANRCWMCQGDLKSAPKRSVPLHRDAKPVWAGNESTTLILFATLCVLVFLVGIGSYASEPGLLIPFAIIATPALLATIIRASRKRHQGKPMGIGETIATFFISGIAVLGILILVVVAVVVGFIFYCFAELARH
jgi:RsiW-degrading membrane proteinase PrsW (M82 family)